MAHFDLGLELYTSMLRVSKGGSPADEVLRLLELAPNSISLKGKSRAERRVNAARLWHGGRPVKEVCSETGLGHSAVYKIIEKLRRLEKYSPGG